MTPNELRDRLLALQGESAKDAKRCGPKMTLDKMYALGVSDGYGLSAGLVDKHLVVREVTAESGEPK